MKYGILAGPASVDTNPEIDPGSQAARTWKVRVTRYFVPFNEVMCIGVTPTQSAYDQSQPGQHSWQPKQTHNTLALYTHGLNDRTYLVTFVD